MRNALALIAPLLIGACAAAPDAPIVDAEIVRQQGPVAIGEALRLGDVYVTPISVVEDSRCPVDAQCVWQGTVKVELRVDGAGWRETEIVEWMAPVAIRGHNVELDAVMPAPRAGHSIPLADYRFVFSN